MKLLTHNLMICNSKTCRTKDIPLSLKFTQVIVKPAEFNKPFIIKLLPKLNWPLLISTAKIVLIKKKYK